MASYRKRGATWYVRYRDEHGKQLEVKAGPDQGMARRIGAELESRVQAIKAGAIDPRESIWAEAERTPLTDHVAAWHASLVAKGSSPSYADLSRDRVLRLIELARIFRISHLSISTVQAGLKVVRSMPGRCGNATLSDRSVFHHVRAIKMFSKWLWCDGRQREDALVHLSPPKVVNKRERRALTIDEATALITTARTRPVVHSLSGEDRSVLYALALGTGFRANEIRNLTPEDCDLDASPPTVRCRAAYAKNRTQAIQPIRTDLADLLRPWLASRPPRRRIFGNLTDKMADTIREDLAAAGVEDAEEFDFHCLRHSYVSHLIQSGVSVKVAQVLARHADPAMTLGVYTHVQSFDLSRGLEGVPALGIAPAATVVVTGTHGPTLAHTLPTPRVSGGRPGTLRTVKIPGKTASHSVPSRHIDRTTEPKVSGSNPLGCTAPKSRRILGFGYLPRRAVRHSKRS